MKILRSKKLIKQVSTLPLNLRKQIFERVRIFTENEFDPILNNHALNGRHAGSRSINVNGDYRMLYRRIDSETVYLHIIGTHHQLYGK